MAARRNTMVLGWLAAGALTLGVVAGCGSDDSNDDAATTTTAAASGDSAKTVAFDKTIQQQLKDVGCYDGDVDGIMGPATDQAIIDFQTAEGLTVDGELGPATDTALRDAAESGRTVCGGGSSGTTTPPVTITPSTGTAPCTATAVAAALPSGDEVTTYICSEGWAAGSATNGEDDSNFILQAEDGKWVQPAQSPCGTASAGLPAEILKYCDAS